MGKREKEGEEGKGKGLFPYFSLIDSLFPSPSSLLPFSPS